MEPYMNTLREILAYHGGDSLTADSDLRVPLFVALKKQDSVWYAVDRHAGDNPVIVHLDVEVHRPMDTLRGDHDMLDVAKAAGIKFKTDPYFHCSEIRKHGGEPDMVNDLVYIPSFVEALRKMGYDSIKTTDVLLNGSIEVLILLDKSQFKIKDVEEVDVDE